MVVNVSISVEEILDLEIRTIEGQRSMNKASKGEAIGKPNIRPKRSGIARMDDFICESVEDFGAKGYAFPNKRCICRGEGSLVSTDFCPDGCGIIFQSPCQF